MRAYEDERTGKYIKRYASSFMGYAPLNKPRVTVVVTINGTKQFGGVIAAPVFREVTMKALRLLGEMFAQQVMIAAKTEQVKA